jgi:bla regulator protein blaR1
MLLPVGPSSSLSLEGLVNATLDQLESAAEQGSSPTASNATMAGPVNHLHLEREALKATIARRQAAQQNETWQSVEACLPTIWFVVGAGGLVFTLGTYWKFRRRVGNGPVCTDARLLSLWSECCRIAGVRRHTALVLFDGVELPAIMGAFRPTLLLPLDAGKFSDRQLRLVMLHELAHVRRWDIAANWLLVAIRAMQWWNPIYWLAVARFRSLQEQACDAFVVRRMAGEPLRDYRDLLLTFAERRPTAVWRVSLPASILGIFPAWFRRRSLQVRLNALQSATIPRGRWQGVAAAGVVLLLAFSGLTNAKVDQPPQDVASWMAQPVRAMNVPDSYRVRPKFNGPRVTRCYDVRVVLERMAEQEKIDRIESPDQVGRMLTSLFKPMFSAASEARQHVSASDASAPRPAESSPLTFELDGDQLLVKAPVEVQRRVERSLSVWAESGFGQICVSSRIINSARDLTAAAGITWEHIEAISSSPAEPQRAVEDGDSPSVGLEHRVEDYLPVAFAKLDEQHSTALIDAAQGDRRTNVLNAPKITMFNGQEAMLADYAQRPFVVGVRPVVGELGTAMQPKIVTLKEGTEITVHAVQSRDLKTIHLKQRMEMISVGQVETATASVQGQEVTIQIPQVQRYVLNVDTEIKSDQSLLVACLPTRAKREYQYVLLTVKNIEDADE